MCGQMDIMSCRSGLEHGGAIVTGVRLISVQEGHGLSGRGLYWFKRSEVSR